MSEGRARQGRDANTSGPLRLVSRHTINPPELRLPVLHRKVLSPPSIMWPLPSFTFSLLFLPFSLSFSFSPYPCPLPVSSIPHSSLLPPLFLFIFLGSSRCLASFTRSSVSFSSSPFLPLLYFGFLSISFIYAFPPLASTSFPLVLLFLSLLHLVHADRFPSFPSFPIHGFFFIPFLTLIPIFLSCLPSTFIYVTCFLFPLVSTPVSFLLKFTHPEPPLPPLLVYTHSNSFHLYILLCKPSPFLLVALNSQVSFFPLYHPLSSLHSFPQRVFLSRTSFHVPSPHACPLLFTPWPQFITLKPFHHQI